LAQIRSTIPKIFHTQTKTQTDGAKNRTFGWGKGWNVTSAGCQVTLCDPIWHVNSSSSVTTSVSELLYPCYYAVINTTVLSEQFITVPSSTWCTIHLEEVRKIYGPRLTSRRACVREKK